MKILDAIKNVDKSYNNETEADFSDFCRELGIVDGIGYYTEFAERVRGYYLIKWICTDTWVGTIVYFLDNEPIAVSTQNARKSDTNYAFVSKEAANKMRDFILSIIDKEENEVGVLDPEIEIDDFYYVCYSSQLLVNEGYVEGRHCEVVDKFKYGYISKQVKVVFDDGEERIVPVNLFKIPLHLRKENVSE